MKGASGFCTGTFILVKILTTAGAAFLTTGEKDKVFSAWLDGTARSWAAAGLRAINGMRKRTANARMQSSGEKENRI